MKISYAPIKDGKLSYESSGKGDVVVFLHADSVDRRMWEYQLNFLAKYFRVISLDLRGFGKSTLPKNMSYSFHEDLKQFIDFLDIDKANLVGLSLGSAVALDFTLIYPNITSSLLLANSGIGGKKFSDRLYQVLKKTKNLAQLKGLNEAKKYWLNLPFLQLVSKNRTGEKLLETMVKDYSGYRWAGKNQSKSLKPAAAQRLNEIKCPSLIINSDHDEDDFKYNGIYLRENIKNNKFVEIKNAGHFSNLDQPTEFNKVIFNFLSK